MGYREVRGEFGLLAVPAMVLALACSGSDAPPVIAGMQQGSGGAPDSGVAAAAGGASAGGDQAGDGGASSGGASGGAGAAQPVCVPGQSIACAGPAGCSGGQACKADGSGYEPCACAAVPPPDAGEVGNVPHPFAGPGGQQWACMSSTAAPTMCQCSTDIATMRTACAERGWICLPGRCPTLTIPCCVKPASDQCICQEQNVAYCHGGSSTSCP